jgi:hypothetical protein
MNMRIGVPNKNHRRIPKIPALKDPIILYIDNAPESRKAKALLEKSGLSPFLETGRVEPSQKKPLVLYNGGIYQGLSEIQSLLRLLSFWTEQPVCSLVFADGAACKTNSENL